MSSTTSVFDNGKYTTILLNINSSKNVTSPPKPLLVGTPTPQGGGKFGVVLLLHGFMLCNNFYSQLIQHVASHGFIVIAPQLYKLAGKDASDEVKVTAAIIEWLATTTALEDALSPYNVKPDTTKLALSGHSRGGKVAFALALGEVASSPLKLYALIGIDPVDGSICQTPPKVLTYVPNSFELNGMPVMVIGSGLGPEKKGLIGCPCAPAKMNHVEFYRECQDPACHMVAKKYGHMDMLDDDTPGLAGTMSYAICKNGESRGPMRRFVGGAMVAFLNAYLEGHNEDLLAIKDGKADPGLELVDVDFRL